MAEQLSLFDQARHAAHREGFDPDRRLPPEMMERVYDQIRHAGAPRGMVDDVAAWAEYLTNDPEARLRMQLCREAGISYKQGLERWGDPEDIAAELAWSALRAEDRSCRCPNCNTKPEDWTFELKREGLPSLIRQRDDPPFKFELWDCYGCDMLHHLNKTLSDEERAAGKRYLIRPRKPGEPVTDTW